MLNFGCPFMLLLDLYLGLNDMLCCSWSEGSVWEARVHRWWLSEGTWAHRAGIPPCIFFLTHVQLKRLKVWEEFLYPNWWKPCIFVLKSWKFYLKHHIRVIVNLLCYKLKNKTTDKYIVHRSQFLKDAFEGQHEAFKTTQLLWRTEYLERTNRYLYLQNCIG